MSFDPERLQVIPEEMFDNRQRWTIVLRNTNARDLYPVKFHQLVRKETAEAVLAVLRNDEHLQRVLK